MNNKGVNDMTNWEMNHRIKLSNTANVEDFQGGNCCLCYYGDKNNCCNCYFQLAEPHQLIRRLDYLDKNKIKEKHLMIKTLKQTFNYDYVIGDSQEIETSKIFREKYCLINETDIYTYARDSKEEELMRFAYSMGMLHCSLVHNKNNEE